MNMTYTPGSNTVGYRPLNSSTKLTDYQGKNAFTGYNGSTTYNSGTFAGVECLNITDMNYGRYWLTSLSGYPTGGTSRTFSIWCYLATSSGSTYNYAFSFHSGSVGVQALKPVAFPIAGKIGGDGTSISSKWTLLTFTYASGVNSFYVNGELIGTYNGTQSTQSISSSYPFRLGHDLNATGGTGWYGGLSNLIIENKARTQAEVTSYFNSTKGNYGYFVPDYLHWDTQGPCPDGYHIPTQADWQAVYDVGASLGQWSDTNGDGARIKLKLPFAGRRDYNNTGTIRETGSYGYYHSSSADTTNSGYVIVFDFDRTYIRPGGSLTMATGRSIRPFKNSPVVPDSTWTVIYQGTGNAGVFHNASLGLISISSNGTNWITIADKNLGATTVYNNGDTLSEANCGKYYQWGNNYGFPFTGTISNYSTSQINASEHGPGNYYSSNTWIAANPWDKPRNYNLRGGVTDERPLPPYEGNELCFTANTAGSTVRLYAPSKHPTYNVYLETSTDGRTWTDYNIGDTITLNSVGDKVWFRSTSTTVSTFSTGLEGYLQFEMTGGISSSGDVGYLLCKTSTTSITKQYTFYNLFHNCTSLTTMPSLPATTVGTGCYEAMFDGCTSLAEIQPLPATTLGNECYKDMFSRCINITSLPALPATTLKDSCYLDMFYGCTGIKLSTTKTSEYQTEYRIPNKGTGTTANKRNQGMFNGTGGTFTGAPSINTTYYTSGDIIPQPSHQPLLSKGIFHSPSLGLISISSGDGEWITISDKNLGATNVGDYGNYYQWGNNYGFTSTPTKSTTRVDASSYGPGNYYSNSNFITTSDNADWSTVRNDNLWGNVTNTNISRQGPCLPGYHIPSRNDVGNLLSCIKLIKGADVTGEDLSTYLKFPNAGYLTYSGGNISSQGTLGIVRTSTSGVSAQSSGNYPAGYVFDTTNGTNNTVNRRGTGYPIRPFKNTPVEPDNTWTRLYPLALNKYITKLYHLGKEYIFDERVSTTGINVSPTSISLTKLNQTAQITASVIPTNADDNKIIYTSSAPSIVSVSSTGLVKALGEGNATITVKSNDGGFSKSVSVNVSQVVDALCFTANTAGSTIKLDKVGDSSLSITLQYSTNGTSWSSYSFSGLTGQTITLSNAGDKVYFRNKSTTDASFSKDTSKYCYFVMTGSINASGSVGYLLNKSGSNITRNYCFYNLFYNCSALKTPPELPATSVLTYSYSQMFMNSGITKAPSIPATSVSQYCFKNMFRGCTALEELPVLSTTSIKQESYFCMFYGCSKIKLSTTKTGDYQTAYRIPSSGAGTTSTDSLYYMFQSTGGTFTGTPSINTTYYTSNKVV